MIASERGLADIVALLLTSRADPNSATDNGLSALVVASVNGHTQVVEQVWPGCLIARLYICLCADLYRKHFCNSNCKLQELKKFPKIQNVLEVVLYGAVALPPLESDLGGVGTPPRPRKIYSPVLCSGENFSHVLG